MVAPEPLTPFRRSVVRGLGTSYETGWFVWSFAPRYSADVRPVSALTDTSAAYVAASSTRAGRRFLIWSRFPLVDDSSADTSLMRLDDARYGGPGRVSFASVTVPRARPLAPQP